ncbi:hypothetical protein E2C01_075308 [Portunus trituberculatus]|uniref:Uncharacterized protein n=1 Tax=Portunus trituberculatus TaxID=210409 RepID=A0A5B7I880_PORTR|nr:hypothetical protein [Portunus trituberculatus]
MGTTHILSTTSTTTTTTTITTIIIFTTTTTTILQSFRLILSDLLVGVWFQWAFLSNILLYKNKGSYFDYPLYSHSTLHRALKNTPATTTHTHSPLHTSLQHTTTALSSPTPHSPAVSHTTTTTTTTTAAATGIAGTVEPCTFSGARWREPGGVGTRGYGAGFGAVEGLWRAGPFCSSPLSLTSPLPLLPPSPATPLLPGGQMGQFTTYERGWDLSVTMAEGLSGKAMRSPASRRLNDATYRSPPHHFTSPLHHIHKASWKV